jgi:hypothetical protein
MNQTTTRSLDMDLAEFVSDYVQSFIDCGEQIPKRKKLAKMIAADIRDYGERVSPAEVEYYLD